jgi:hypothetical protein
MRLNNVHAINIFDEMQNGAIWGYFRVVFMGSFPTKKCGDGN